MDNKDEALPNKAPSATPTEQASQNEDPTAESDAESEGKGKRRRLTIEYITDKARRQVTFSKRKAGIMKKAFQLSALTGTEVLLLIASETGHVYTYATPKLQPVISRREGKELIMSCLSAGKPVENSPAPDDAVPSTPAPPLTPQLPHIADTKERKHAREDTAPQSTYSPSSGSSSSDSFDGILPPPCGLNGALPLAAPRPSVPSSLAPLNIPVVAAPLGSLIAPANTLVAGRLPSFPSSILPHTTGQTNLSNTPSTVSPASASANRLRPPLPSMLLPSSVSSSSAPRMVPSPPSVATTQLFLPQNALPQFTIQAQASGGLRVQPAVPGMLGGPTSFPIVLSSAGPDPGGASGMPQSYPSLGLLVSWPPGFQLRPP